MKIKAALTKKEYIYEMKGNMIIVNGENIVLSSLPTYDNTEMERSIDWYKDNGKIQGTLYINTEQQFLLINGNLKRFHDIDLNTEITIANLEDIIKLMNTPRLEVIKERKKIKDKFLETGTEEDWIKKGEL